MKKIVLSLVAAAVTSLALPAFAQQAPIKLGLITTLNGPLASAGKEQVLGIEAAMKKLGNKIGGVPATLVVEDSKMTVDTAQQTVSKLIEQDKVDFLVGNMLSNQLLAYAPRAVDAGVFVLSAVPGPSEFAGKQCNPGVFMYSWENNTPSEAVGRSMSDAGSKKAFFIAQNYVTGKEHVAGAKFYYKGAVAGEAYVPFTQVDFSAELASIRASGADSVYVFLPGAAGIAFIKQFEGAGLKDKVSLFGGSWLADEHSFPAFGDTALGLNLAGNWFATLNNPANKEFVDQFKKDNGRNPVFYAATAYDSIMALDSAVRALNGNIKDKTALRRELEKADFKSVRGNFKFNNNHMPIQTFYAAKVVKKDGTLMHEAGKVIFADHRDRFYQECNMK